MKISSARRKCVTGVVVQVAPTQAYDKVRASKRFGKNREATARNRKQILAIRLRHECKWPENDLTEESLPRKKYHFTSVPIFGFSWIVRKYDDLGTH
jgi:hypothetical protein